MGFRMSFGVLFLLPVFSFAMLGWMNEDFGLS
jgi:hypothetical protein